MPQQPQIIGSKVVESDSNNNLAMGVLMSGGGGQGGLLQLQNSFKGRSKMTSRSFW